MGTKKQLRSSILSICDHLPAGPFVDLFAGISSSGLAVASKRQVWCNDAQVFSYTLTQSLFCSTDEAPRLHVVVPIVRAMSCSKLESLVDRIYDLVKDEKEILERGSTCEQIMLQHRLLALSAEWRQASRWQDVETHCLFTTFYAGGYVGAFQAIQLDAIRFGIEEARGRKIISVEEHRWALIALCEALSKVSNSTGHFAQFLSANERNVHRVIAKRRRCVWKLWTEAMQKMLPIGDAEWRSANQSFLGDALGALGKLRRTDAPAIIYADPPYTSDQYSRYYHLFETLLLYDYPVVTGKALYRQGRFQSSFSLARNVRDSFETLIEGAAQIGSALMVSYPSGGLLPNAVHTIPEMMGRHYKQVFEPIVIPHQHSTLGASKGRQKEDVEECFFVALR